MKLRVAHIDTSDRMAGIFAVQRRVWGSWYDMYLNADASKIQPRMMLGEGDVKPAHFDDFHEAVKYARAYKQCSKRIIRETWKV